MPARLPALLRPAALAAAALLGLSPASARAGVVLSELHAAPSERFLRWDASGQPRLGAGPAWFDPGFADDAWPSGPAPLGFGFGGLGTDVGGDLAGRTPSLYVRRHFTATADAAARLEPLRLRVSYNDGFVAFLNGREVARARLGPPGLFIYADATAFSIQTNTGVETFDLGPAASLLRPGDNVLAIQVQNHSIDAKGNLRIDAALEFAGGVFATPHLAEDFNNANGAARTHTNAAGVIQNGSLGTPPPGSWLATAPNPASSPAWTSFSVLQTLATNGGTADSGHLHLRLAGTGPAQPALIYGPGVVMTPSWSAGAVTGEQLDQTVLDLRYQAPPGFRIDLVAEPLSGDRTRVLELGSLPPVFGTPGPTADTIGWWRFDDAGAAAGGAIPHAASVANPGALTGVVAGGTPRWTTDVPGPRILDPLSGTIYENRFACDATAALSRFHVTNQARLDTTNGSFTMEFFLKLTGEAGGYDPFVRRTVGIGSAASSTIRRWQVDIDRSATRAGFGRVRSRWDTPGVPPPDYNRVVAGDRIYVDTAAGSGNPNDYPADGTATDYASFGDNTNDLPTARWYHVALTVDAPSRRVTIFHDYTPGGSLVLNTNFLHPAAVLEFGKMTSSNYAVALDEIRYASRVLATGEMLRVVAPDAAGFHAHTVRLGDAPAAQRAAFLGALNAAGGQGFRPALRVRDESVAAAPGRELRLDDVRVTYQQQSAFFPPGGPFRYLPGRAEPSGGLFEPNLPPEPNNPFDQASVPPFPDLPGFADWIELHNDGPEPVRLDGWSLTDSSDKDQWRFPTNTVLPPDGRLLVLCDERTDVTNAAYLHANFKLSEGGERVRLYSNGVLQADVDYPRQDHFRSYGLLPGTTNYAYLELPSPGIPNAGPASAFRCRTPDFSVPGGLYTGSVSLVITSATVTAEIRYTLDGSEPTPASLLYAAPLPITASTNDRSGTVVRARAFQAGAVPSGTRSATYLINQNPALTNLPALCLSAEAGRNLFLEQGVLAIRGGTFQTNGIWAATNIADYNLPLMHGRPYERPVFVEWHRADGQPGFAEEAGLRLAGSPHARPRYKLAQTGLSPWPANFTEKPSFNLFWREDYDQSALDYPFLGQDYPVKTFDQLRPRAGKNDVSNPFIKDELVRRVFSDMGHATVRGNLNTLYLNGSYKGFYNTVERYRTSFFQAHYGSSAEWDIRINDGLEEGDSAEWTNLLAVLNTDLNVRTNYDRAMAGLVLDEVIDYFLINLYVGMWDWPGNNWVAARERTPQGRFRLHLWDAEGSFGQGGLKPPSYDHITTDLRNGTASLPTLFKHLFGDGSASNQALKAETRLRFADRVHRHFFHGGALDDRVPTNTVWARRLAELGAAFAPVLQYTHGTAWSTAFWTNWTTATTANWTFNGVANTPLPRRRAFLFGPVTVTPPGGTATNVDLSFRRHGFWPATEPPALSQQGGAIPPGTPVSLATNGTAPAGSLIFYTLNGSDPRAFGGSPGPAALTYTGPFTLPGPVQTTVKARVRNSLTGEWSPLTEALFILNASQPAPGDLAVSHLHYQPADANLLEQAAGFADRDSFEFLELMNISPRVVDLQDVNFTAGISFIDWTASPVQALAPGETVLLVKNLAAFRTRYGTSWNPRLAGEYLGQLDNSGERVLLVRGEGVSGVILRDFYYWDQPPWPNSADGNGASLVLRHPAANPDHSLAENWDGSGGWTAPTNSLSWLVGWLAWRNKYFLTAEQLTNAAISGLAADPDADGLNNEQEFQADTHPLDPASGLVPALGLTATNFSLTFRAKAYRTYTLESRPQVHTGPWQVDTNFPATPTNRWETLLGPLPPAGTNRFFRLRLP